MTTLHVSHTLFKLSRSNYGGCCLVVFEYNHLDFAPQQLFPQVESRDPNCPQRMCASVLEFAVEPCFLEAAVSGKKVCGPMRTRNTPPVDFCLSLSPAKSASANKCSAEILEHGPVSGFVADVVSAEDSSSFVFLAFVIIRKLCVLLNADVEDPTDMRLNTTPDGISLDGPPLLDLVLIPASLPGGAAGLRDSPETVPLRL